MKCSAETLCWGTYMTCTWLDCRDPRTRRAANAIPQQPKQESDSPPPSAYPYPANRRAPYQVPQPVTPPSRPRNTAYDAAAEDRRSDSGQPSPRTSASIPIISNPPVTPFRQQDADGGFGDQPLRQVRRGLDNLDVDSMPFCATSIWWLRGRTHSTDHFVKIPGQVCKSQ